MHKGPMDKAKPGKDWQWEEVLGGAGESSGGKWRQLYLNNNKNKHYED